jgi:hypothetical protein
MKQILALLLLPLALLMWLALAISFVSAVVALSGYYRLKSFVTRRRIPSPPEHDDLLRADR